MVIWTAGKPCIEAWQNLLSTQKQVSELDKLKASNQFFNKQMRYVEDIDLWHEVGYWATPVESLIKGVHDCEGYAIAKYLICVSWACPAKFLIAYVKALRLNYLHIVLTYQSSPNLMPLVLASLLTDIKPAGERPDLLSVYSFNAEEVWLPGTEGNKNVGDNKRLSRWQDVLEKMIAEGFPTEPEN